MQIHPLFSQIGTFVAAATPFSLIIIGVVNKFFTRYNPKLGKTTTICTNVIGTLTKKELMVRTIYFDQFKLTKEDKKNFLKIENTDSKEELLMEITGLSKDATLQLLATAINLCRYDKLKRIEKTIINFFVKGGINKHKIHNKYEIIEKIATNEKKKMTTVVVMKKKSQEIFSFTKGHPKTILKNCSRIQINDKKEELTHPQRRKIRKHIDQLNKNGQKVIALAYKPLPIKKLNHYTENFTEQDMVFLGIIGVTEPLNTDIIESIEETKKAGIKTYILSHTKEKKAVAIGKQLKIINPQYFESISGPYLERISDQKLDKILSNKEKDYVFYELNEKERLKIIDRLYDLGETVAISDQYLTDFNKLVSGIKRGRIIEQNRKKYLTHALSCKIGELILLVTALILRVPLPLTITIIIGIDIAINLLLELSLRVDKTDIDPLMTKPQKKPTITSLITNGISIGILTTTVFLFSLYIYGWTFNDGLFFSDNTYTKPVTITVAFLAIVQILNAFNHQTENKSIFKFSLLRNPYLVLTAIISGLFIYMFLNLEFFKNHRSITNITTLEWQLIAFFAVFIIIIEEFRKFISRITQKNADTKE